MRYMHYALDYLLWEINKAFYDFLDQSKFDQYKRLSRTTVKMKVPELLLVMECMKSSVCALKIKFHWKQVTGVTVLFHDQHLFQALRLSIVYYTFGIEALGKVLR